VQDASVAQIQSLQTVLKVTKEFLISCPSDVYYIVHQPSIRSDDLTPSAIPNLQTALSSSTVKTKYLVPEARGLGSDVTGELVTHLRDRCGEIRLLDRDASVQTHEALESQISRALKDDMKVVVLETMEELSGLRMSTQRVAMLDEIGTLLPCFVCCLRC
jgi:hypothetical protein